MALLETPQAQIGAPALDFSLTGVDGKTYQLKDISGPKASLVMFICNHCPYVKAIISRLAQQCAQLQDHGVGVAAICSNDAKNYPDDSFENMKIFAQTHKFSFPYLCDDSQQTAHDYGAVCTPDFFGYDADLKLAFRGRIDGCGLDAPGPETVAELLEAMLEVAQGQKPSRVQIPSMGCSIKWK